MISIGILIVLIPAMIIITAAAFFIYKALYDKHTNKVLESGETQKRKWLAPWAFTLIVFGAQLLITAGIMYAASMFMFKTDSVQAYQVAADDCPVSVDINGSVKFVIEDPNYVCEGVLDNEYLTIDTYKRTNKDGSSNYIFIGTIEKTQDGPISVLAELEGMNNECYATTAMTQFDFSPDASVVYFKCEVRLEPEERSELNVGIKYGSSISSDDKFSQQFTVTLG